MCSINHDLKAIFIHVHKTGGTYLSYTLHKYYGFKNYYLRRPDHDTFCFNKVKTTKYINYENRIHGVLKYYKTSNHLNKIMGMTLQKWDNYYKFAFIRNPYDKIVSAWNHVNRFKIPFKNFLNLTNICNDVEYMHMFMPQNRNIVNEKGKIGIDFIGKFETLEDDFQVILKNIGVKNIIHDYNKKMNKRDHMDFYKYYDQDTLDKVNLILLEDFLNLDYPMIKDIYEFINIYNHEDEENDIKILKDSDEINEIKLHNDPKIVCIYSYFETSKISMYNFIYFLKNGILNNIHYYILINGTTNIKIPFKINVTVIYTKNKTNDFSAYCHCVSNIKKSYDYYIFLSSSVIYPLINMNKEDKNWTNNFIPLFDNNVKLIGSELINLNKNNYDKYNLDKIYGKKLFSYFKSSFFVIDFEYFKFLNTIHFFNEDELIDKEDDYIIVYKNIALMEYLLKNNWNFNNIYILKDRKIS